MPLGRLNKFSVYRCCRIFICASLVAGYILTYALFPSNSDVILSAGDHYVYHNYRATETKSLYELHLSEIRKRASTIARVYQPSHPSTWCIDASLKFEQMTGQPMGLCYLRIPHSAGATLKGINIRISRNFPQRYGIDRCIRHDSYPTGMDFARRDKLSYLWTFLRDPTDRAMSVVGSKLSHEFYLSSERGQFEGAISAVDSMARNNTSENATNKSNSASTRSNMLVLRTLDMLQHATNENDGILSKGWGGFQLALCAQDDIRLNEEIVPSRPTDVIDHLRLLDAVSKTFQKYDFVGLLERFDESLVVMQLLLGLESSDILYFAANRKEEWQRAKVGRRRFVCRKSFDWQVDLATQPLIGDYLAKSKTWYAQNYGDFLFYQAANQSLDQTISKIGPDLFASELKKFRWLIERAHEECIPKFPCSSDGREQYNESLHDCVDGYACGYHCFNDLSFEKFEST